MGEIDSHPGEEELEQYSLGTLPEAAIPAIEQHLLICAACQDRTTKIDAQVQGMQAESRAIRSEENKDRKTMRGGSGSKS